MSCNGYAMCGGNNSCMWTLIIIAVIFVWLNCAGGTIGGSCGNGCGCNDCGCC